MQRTFLTTAHFDRLGVIASSACVVHCILTPVVFSLLAVYAHLLPSEEHTHRVLAVLVALLGAVAIVTGYRKHRKSNILLLMAVGLSFIFFGAFAGDRLPSHLCEVAVTLAGSSFMIAAHRRNHTFCRRCAHCDRPNHD